jgi:hypothetical protein
MNIARYAAAAALIASSARAQGNVSTQGYGYPQGQVSSRALGMGASIAEIDQGSMVNPASIGRLTTRTVSFQLEPEYRSVTGAAGSNKTTTARYPLVSIGVPAGEHWVIGVSSSSLLDRTWQTSTTRTIDVGGDAVSTTIAEGSDGAINDLRVAAGWTNRRWLYLGLGVHGITGRNVLTTTQVFDDSAFNVFSSDRVLSYTGSAISGGAQVFSASLKSVFGVSYRLGNAMKVLAADSTVTRGDVPSHLGASMAFTGIPGTVLSMRVAHDGWSSMTKMLSTTVAPQKAHDNLEIGAGAEFTGPRVLGQALMIRTGGRQRTLPFEAAGKEVTERTASLGSGANFGGGRMSVDLALLRQWRSADLPSVKERAWTFSLSLTARP